MGNPLRIFHFWVFNFELGEFWQQDIGSWGCGLVWLMFCEEALTPSDIYPCVISSEGESLAIFLFCTFHVGIGRRFRWHEASVWRLGYQACLFRVRVYTLIHTINRAVTTIPLDKVNNHFSDRIIINYDFSLGTSCMFDMKSCTQHWNTPLKPMRD